MQKRVLFVVLGISAAALLTGGVLVASKKIISVPNLSLQTAPSSNPTPAPPKLLTWDDPAGFTFQYPEGLTVNKHDEDNESYAHVEFTSQSHPGSLIVWAKDTNSADVTAWVRTEKSFVGAPILDTTLGSKPAKKMTLASGRLITGTIFEELLFSIDTTLADKTYWSGIHEQVANSFTFKPQAPPAGGSDAGAAADSAVDEEETVQ